MVPRAADGHWVLDFGIAQVLGGEVVFLRKLPKQGSRSGDPKLQILPEY